MTAVIPTAGLAKEISASLPGWTCPEWADSSCMEGDEVQHVGYPRPIGSDHASLHRRDTLSIGADLEITVSLGPVEVIFGPDLSCVSVEEARAIHAALGSLLARIKETR